jgi:hypothetical protein
MSRIIYAAIVLVRHNQASPSHPTLNGKEAVFCHPLFAAPNRCAPANVKRA